MHANPWILEVSGVGWGVLLCKDFAYEQKKRSKELLLQEGVEYYNSLKVH